MFIVRCAPGRFESEDEIFTMIALIEEHICPVSFFKSFSFFLSFFLIIYLSEVSLSHWCNVLFGNNP